MASRAALIVALLGAPAAVRAQAPPWANAPCAGLDCAATPAGVGAADLLPEPAVSSAIAYAQASRALAASLESALSVRERVYGEDADSTMDGAVKDLVRSPLGAALTKTYALTDSDMITTTIDLRPPVEPGVRVFAQESVDVSSRTLYVRLALSRDPAAAAPPGFSLWPGRRVRLSAQDIRVGRQNELIFWVEDADAGLTWMEQWPTGGADLVRAGGRTEKFVFDGLADAWKPAPPPPR